MNPDTVDVRHNEAERRFEAHVDGLVAVAEYIPSGSRRVFVHTEVPEPLEGQGVGGRLVRAALDQTIADGLGIFPVCPFVASFIRRHPEYREHVRLG